MKKLIIVLLLVVACFAMCSCTIEDKKIGEAVKSEGFSREVKGVTHYEYEGHRYLIFTCNTDHYSVGVVHDPSCWCRKHIIYYAK